MKKVFILIIVLFLAVLAALEIYVQSDAFAARIRPYIAGPLQEVLGPDASIGFVQVNLLPPFLEVRNIVLPDERGTPAVTIRKVTVYLNPLPLVFKKIRLPSITILEPRFFAKRASDGTVNLRTLAERIRANIAGFAGGKPSGYRLLLRTITVRKGEIWFKDEGLSSQVSVTDLNITSRFNLASDKVAVAVRSSNVRITAPAYPEIRGALKASAEYNRGTLRLNPVELVSGDASLSVHGEVGPLPDAVLDLEARLRSGPQTLGRIADIMKPKNKKKGTQMDARFVIHGRAADPQIEGSSRLSGLSYGGMTLQNASLTFRYRDHGLSVNGSNVRVIKDSRSMTIENLASSLAYRQGILTIENFELKAGDLTAGIRGTIDPAKGFDAHLAARSSGEGHTLSFLTSLPVEGSIDLEGQLTGAVNTPVVSGTIAAGPLTVRGIQFGEVAGKIAYRDKKVSLSSVDIRRQSSHLIFEATADFGRGEPFYTARLRAVQAEVASIVALFYKTLPLQTTAKGELSFEGTAREYTGSGYLSFDSGNAYGESFERGAVTASLSTGRISFPQIVLYKKKGMVKAAGWIGFDGTYSADLESRDVDLSEIDHLSGISAEGTVELELHSSGTFTDPALTASLNLEELSIRGVDVGQLHGEGEIKNKQLTFKAGISDENVRMSLTWLLRKPFPWTVETKIQADSVHPFLLFSKKDVSERIQLTMNGAVTVSGRGLSHASIYGEALFERLGIVMGDYRIDNVSSVDILIRDDKLVIKSLDLAGPGTRITVMGMTKTFADVDFTVHSRMELPLMRLLVPEVEHAAGNAEMKLTVKKDWANPEVSGELRIQGGEIKIQDIPQKFSALNGTITLTKGRVATESLSGEMGGGTIGVSGWAQFAGIALHEFSIKTTVDNITVRYPEGLTSTLSGDLYYDGDVKLQTLSGDVTIKRARYDKRIEWKTMLVDIGRGLYQKKKTAIGWLGDTQINVRFHGSDNILFQNNLAKIPLDVDVFLRGTVNHPQLLGRLEARKGTVFFRKNEFKILHASADFIDPNRLNPVLDIQAETQVREYLIRLAVTGNADRAAVTLISDPPLVDTDILSLLALGKKGSELKGKETNVGVGEAASFATGQFQDIFEKRARSLTGLDRFQVDPYVSKSDTSVPRVTVGKELVQNKLYVTYSANVGASIPEQIFRIEYILDKHFSLIGEQNDIGNTGADIKYRFEFK
jgi:translocation and assembly module TamB